MTDEEPKPEPKPEEAPRKPAKKASRPVRRKPARRKARELELEKEVGDELEQLRGLLRQIGSRCIEKLECEIVQVHEAIKTSKSDPDRLYHLSMMLEALRGLKIKPDKGRIKDLKRIDRTVSLLNRVSLKM